MKRYIVFSLLIMITITSLFWSSKVYGWNKLEGYSTYTNDKYGFAFDYPNSWIVTTGTAKALNTDGYIQYKTHIFRAVSPNPTFVAATAEKASLVIRGVPFVSVSEYVNDEVSYLAEISKSGVSDAINVFVKDEIINKISGKIRRDTFVNNNSLLTAKMDYYGRKYESFSFLIDYETSAILISVVFDPLYYDESFARDIIATIREL